MTSRFYSRNATAQSIVGVILLTITGGALLSLAGAYAFFSLNQQSLDAQNCPTNGPVNLTVVYIDTRGQYEAAQETELRKAIEKVVADLSEGEALHIYHARRAGRSGVEPDFEGCKPRERGNHWYENTEAIAKKFDREFKSKVAQSVERGLRTPTQSEAAILEALVEIGAQSFRRGPTGQKRRLFLISDLVQNNGRISHSKAIPSEEDFRRLPNALSLIPRLPGVAVCLIYLNRSTATRVQGMKHIEFWQYIIEASGAHLGSCMPISDPDVVVFRL